MAAVDLIQLLQWINHAVKGASFSSLQSAITPHVLLLVLSQIVPATHEPSLATVSLDELGAVTVFCNACRRLGMRFLFAPADLLELSGRARLPDDSPAGGGFAAVLACLSELFAISRARGSPDLVDASYAALGTAGGASPLDPTLRLTYAEHEALYTGVFPCTMSASARVRLWQVSIYEAPDRPCDFQPCCCFSSTCSVMSPRPWYLKHAAELRQASPLAACQRPSEEQLQARLTISTPSCTPCTARGSGRCYWCGEGFG